MRRSRSTFNTAGRSVKTGLVCADIVSKWTWAATLLQSANVAFKFGVAGPFWYAAGATIQVLLFGSRRRRSGAAAWALPVCAFAVLLPPPPAPP